MAIHGNSPARMDKSESKKSWHHFDPERRTLLYNDYQAMFQKHGREMGRRDIEEELADRYQCDLRTIQRNLRRAEEEIVVKSIGGDEKRLEIVALDDRWIELRDPQEPEPKKGKVFSKIIIDLYNMETHSVECVYLGKGQWSTLDSVIEEELRQAKGNASKK